MGRWHLDLNLECVRLLVRSIEYKLETAELVRSWAVLQASNFIPSPSPSSELMESYFLLLTGAKIIMPVIEGEYCGLKLLLGNGQKVTMWLYAGRDGDVPGWAKFDTDDGEPILGEDASELLTQMERFLASPSPPKAREVVAEFVERAINLLDGMDGDTEREPDDEAEIVGDDDWNSPVTLSPAHNTPKLVRGFGEPDQPTGFDGETRRDLFSPA